MSCFCRRRSQGGWHSPSGSRLRWVTSLEVTLLGLLEHRLQGQENPPVCPLLSQIKIHLLWLIQVLGRMRPGPVGSLQVVGRMCPGPIGSLQVVGRMCPGPIGSLQVVGRMCPGPIGSLQVLGRMCPGPIGSLQVLGRMCPMCQNKDHIKTISLLWHREICRDTESTVKRYNMAEGFPEQCLLCINLSLIFLQFLDLNQQQDWFLVYTLTSTTAQMGGSQLSIT